MSTKNLRVALAELKRRREDGGMGDGTPVFAELELEAIEKAAKEWVEVLGELGPGRMRRLNVLMESIAKEAP